MFCRDFLELESQSESMFLLLSWKGFRDQDSIVTKVAFRVTRIAVLESILHFWQKIGDFYFFFMEISNLVKIAPFLVSAASYRKTVKYKYLPPLISMFLLLAILTNSVFAHSSSFSESLLSSPGQILMEATRHDVACHEPPIPLCRNCTVFPIHLGHTF